MRPLPTGRARTHSTVPACRLCRDASNGSSGWSEAGARYHRLSAESGGAASPTRRGDDGACVAVITLAANAASKHAPVTGRRIEGTPSSCACAVERHDRNVEQTCGGDCQVHFITGCATVSDDAHADQDHRWKSGETGVCDRHRLTAMAGQPTPTFRGRLRLITLARHDRSLPGPAHATYSLTDLVTRHVRGRGVHARGLVASPPGLAGGCKLTRRYRRARFGVCSPPSGPVSTRAE